MSVHFVFATDSHHHADAPKDFGAPKMLTRSREVHEAMIPAINSCVPEFIVHGGDLVCGGGSFEIPYDVYLRTVDEVAEAFAGFAAPIYYVPGNHDCDAQEGSFAAFAERFPIPETLDIVDAAPRLRLALANVYPVSPLENGAGTWTDEHDRLLRAAAMRAHDDRCALLLFIHPWVFPYHEAQGDFKPGGFVDNTEQVLETIREHPAIVAVFTGHKHVNRIRVHRDFLVVDTACLIGFPMGFREIWLEDDGYFRTRFRPLDLPDLMQASFARSEIGDNQRWQGEVHDRDTEILVPRLREIWG